MLKLHLNFTNFKCTESVQFTENCIMPFIFTATVSSYQSDIQVMTVFFSSVSPSEETNLCVALWIFFIFFLGGGEPCIAPYASVSTELDLKWHLLPLSQAPCEAWHGDAVKWRGRFRHIPSPHLHAVVLRQCQSRRACFRSQGKGQLDLPSDGFSLH